MMDTKSEHTRESKVNQSCIKNKMYYLYVGFGGVCDCPFGIFKLFLKMLGFTYVWVSFNDNK